MADTSNINGLISPIDYIGTNFESLVNSSLNVIDQVINGIDPLLLSGSTLLVIFIGYRLYLGMGDFKDAIISILKIAFVYVLITSDTYGYKKLLSPFITDLGPWFTGLLNGSSTSTIYDNLDHMTQTAMALYDFALQKVAFTSVSTWFAVLWTYITVFVTFIAAAFLLLMLLGTHLVLTILLVLGPIFIALFLFQSTRNYFFLWVSSVVTNVLIYVIATVVIVLFYSLAHTLVTSQTIDQNNLGKVAGFLLLFMVIAIKVSFDIPGLASSLGGGSSAGAGAGALASAAIGGMAGAAMKGIKAFTSKPEPEGNGGNKDGQTRKPSRSPMGNLVHGAGAVLGAVTGGVGGLAATGANTALNASGVNTAIYNSPAGKATRKAAAGAAKGAAAVKGAAKKVAGVKGNLQQYNAAAAAARRAGGNPTGGNPTGGNPTGGNPTGGNPTGGNPTGGNPTGGNPTGGNPTGGNPTGGNPTGGNPTGGNPTGGTPTGGTPAGGTPAGGTPAGGNPTGGNPTGGNPTGGNPTGGNPTGGTPTGGTPAGGTPAGGTPAGGNPAGGNQTNTTTDSADSRVVSDSSTSNNSSTDTTALSSASDTPQVTPLPTANYSPTVQDAKHSSESSTANALRANDFERREREDAIRIEKTVQDASTRDSSNPYARDYPPSKPTYD